MRKVLIIGATSAIAEATARLFAAAGDALYLVARNPDKLQAVADDLKVRGAFKLGTYCMDANAIAEHETMLDEAYRLLEGLDIVLIAHGTLPDQHACEQSVQTTFQELHTNALSIIALLTSLANRLEQQKHGTIAVISSVAGDRGRQSNYVYGTAKAAVGTFLQGLRNRLYPAGVHVLTIKPGFVDTPMTRHFKKGFLWAKSQGVAQSILKAIQQQRNVVYVPSFWLLIMMIIRSIPEAIFKRLKL